MLLTFPGPWFFLKKNTANKQNRKIIFDKISECNKNIDIHSTLYCHIFEI